MTRARTTTPRALRKKADVPPPRSLRNLIAQLLVLIAVGLGGAHGLNQGWLRELLPEPKIVEPVGVRVYGPAETLAGGEYYFVCEISGDAGNPDWDVSPKQVGALSVLPGLKAVRFQSNEPGKYVITVSVAGAGKQSATEHIEFVNIVAEEQEPEEVDPVVEPPHNEPNIGAGDVVVPPGAVMTAAAELVERALADVDSPDKVAEAKRIKGIVEQLVARIKSGLVAPEADLLLDLEEQIESALGEKVRNWGLFVADVRQTFDELRDEGEAATAADAVPFLQTVAAVLGRAH